MVRILNERGADDFDSKIIGNLHCNQTTTVLMEGQGTDSVNKCRGVKQKFVLPPTLFKILRVALK